MGEHPTSDRVRDLETLTHAAAIAATVPATLGDAPPVPPPAVRARGGARVTSMTRDFFKSCASFVATPWVEPVAAADLSVVAPLDPAVLFAGVEARERRLGVGLFAAVAGAVVAAVVVAWAFSASPRVAPAEETSVSAAPAVVAPSDDGEVLVIDEPFNVRATDDAPTVATAP